VEICFVSGGSVALRQGSLRYSETIPAPLLTPDCGGIDELGRSHQGRTPFTLLQLEERIDELEEQLIQKNEQSDKQAELIEKQEKVIEQQSERIEEPEARLRKVRKSAYAAAVSDGRGPTSPRPRKTMKTTMSN